MHFRTAFTLAIAASVSVMATANAAVGQFSDFVVFGDSLSDTGNAQIGAAVLGLGDPTPAAVGYFNGRFSNGPIYLDLLHDQLTGVGGPSLPIAPVLFNLPLPSGQNYAIGGARAVTNNDPSLDLGFQLQTYQMISGGQIDPDALYVVSFLNNDARAIAQGAADAPDPADSAQAVIDALTALVGGGARHLLLLNAGDLGLEPVFNGQEQAATDASEAVNDALFDIIGPLATGTYTMGDLSITFFDFFAWSNAVVADPAAYGLPANIELETPCFLAAQVDPSVLPGCGGYAWADGIHPSSSVHAALAASLFPLLQQQLVPAPGMVMLFGLGAVALAFGRRRAA